MFVRIKKIKKKEYAYLVKNEWSAKGSRQKVKKYLGKVLRPSKIKEDEFMDVKELSFKEAVLKLVKEELKKHDLVKTSFSIQEDPPKKRKVLALNEGFLCPDTVKQLLEHAPKGNNKEKAIRLAEKILEAGIKTHGHTFVQLFDKIKTEEEKEDTPGSIYY